MLGNHKTIKVGDREIHVKELTAAQTEAVYENLDNKENEKDFILTLSLGKMTREFVEMATDISYEELMDLPPSEVEKVLSAVEEVNKVFFTKLEKLQNRLKELQKTLQTT